MAYNSDSLKIKCCVKLFSKILYIKLYKKSYALFLNSALVFSLKKIMHLIALLLQFKGYAIYFGYRLNSIRETGELSVVYNAERIALQRVPRWLR